MSNPRLWFFTAVLTIFLASCTPTDPTDQITFAPPTVFPGFTTTAPPTPQAGAAGDNVETTAGLFDSPYDVQIAIQTGGGRPFSPRLLGTNVPAWLGKETLANPTFQDRSLAAGITLLRLPGGSWSNAYDWLACEREGLGIDDAAECFWPWAAKPSDFGPLIQALDGSVMYTVNANGTPQEAAALVAFFNGRPDSRLLIGKDRLGRDWGTAGQWAQLRVDRGYPDPLKITYWEVGNEFYGGTAESGTDCSPFGWEDVWTCDGLEYVRGTPERDGFVAFAEAIKIVDSTAQVGAIGAALQRDWSNWGNEVLAGAAGDMDFYIIHQYGFFEPPSDYEEILAQPAGMWAEVMNDYRLALERHSPNRRIPVAVTEFNLFAFQENDSDQLMTRAVNAFYLADTIGQMATQGIDMAAQWNLANGRAENGTDYGLLDSETFSPLPAYYVYPLWTDFGEELLPVQSSLDDPAVLSIFAARRADGTLSVLAINKTDRPLTLDLNIDGQKPAPSGSRHVLTAASLEDQTIVFNGEDQPRSVPAPLPIAWIEPGAVELEPFSISRFFLEMDSS